MASSPRLQEVLERDRKLLCEAVTFLTDIVIPRMVRECIQLSLVPTDGESLKVAMHSQGINMRYLGRVAKLASSRDDLDHLKVCEGYSLRRSPQLLPKSAPLIPTSESLMCLEKCRTCINMHESLLSLLKRTLLVCVTMCILQS